MLGGVEAAVPAVARLIEGGEVTDEAMLMRLLALHEQLQDSVQRYRDALEGVDAPSASPADRGRGGDLDLSDLNLTEELTPFDVTAPPLTPPPVPHDASPALDPPLVPELVPAPSLEPAAASGAPPSALELEALLGPLLPPLQPSAPASGAATLDVATAGASHQSPPQGQ